MAGPRCRNRSTTIGCRESASPICSISKTTVRGGFGLYTFPWNVDTYGSNGLGNAFTSSGNLTDSTNNVSPVVILLGSDGNTNYQGSKGASINSVFKTRSDDPGSL